MLSPCPDCGSLVVSGLEPLDGDDGDDGDIQARQLVEHRYERSEWCTDLECPSNHTVAGMQRVGVNDYTCSACGDRLHAPMSRVLSHRRRHRGESDEPGTYTYL